MGLRRIADGLGGRHKPRASSSDGTASRAKVHESPKKSKVAIWCGDCLKLMRQKIADKSISVVTTSPPYNQGVSYRSYGDDRDEAENLGWLAEVFEEIDRVLTPAGSLFLVIGHAARKPWTAMRVAEVAGESFQVQNQIVWVKTMTVNGESHGQFNPITSKRFLNRTWEFVFHFTKTGKVQLDRLGWVCRMRMPTTPDARVQQCDAVAMYGSSLTKPCSAAKIEAIIRQHFQLKLRNAASNWRG
jgi:site-specific DNA-methyltransferase (adenine-specific)